MVVAGIPRRCVSNYEQQNGWLYCQDTQMYENTSLRYMNPPTTTIWHGTIIVKKDEVIRIFPFLRSLVELSRSKSFPHFCVAWGLKRSDRGWRCDAHNLPSAYQLSASYFTRRYLRMRYTQWRCIRNAFDYSNRITHLVTTSLHYRLTKLIDCQMKSQQVCPKSERGDIWECTAVWPTCRLLSCMLFCNTGCRNIDLGSGDRTRVGQGSTVTSYRDSARTFRLQGGNITTNQQNKVVFTPEIALTAHRYNGLTVLGVLKRNREALRQHPSILQLFEGESYQLIVPRVDCVSYSCWLVLVLIAVRSLLTNSFSGNSVSRLIYTPW